MSVSVFQLDAAPALQLRAYVPALQTFNAAQKILAQPLKELELAFKKVHVPVLPTLAIVPVRLTFNAVSQAPLLATLSAAQRSHQERNRHTLFIKTPAISLVGQGIGP